MLTDLQNIVSRARSGSQDALERDLRGAARALLERQFVFADDHQGHRRYEVIRSHRGFFQDLFDALGFDLRVDEREQVAGILTQDGISARRMSLNETLFLIALRAVFEQRRKEFMLDEAGRCQTTLAEVWSLVEETAKRDRPSMNQCRLIAEAFARNGIVRLGDPLPGGDSEIEIRPVVTLAAGPETAESLERYSLGIADDGTSSDGGHAEAADPAGAGSDGR